MPMRQAQAYDRLLCRDRVLPVQQFLALVFVGQAGSFIFVNLGLQHTVLGCKLQRVEKLQGNQRHQGNDVRYGYIF